MIHLVLEGFIMVI